MKKRLLKVVAATFLGLQLNAQANFQKVYSGLNVDFLTDFVQTPDSGFAILGETYSWGAGAQDLLLIKTNRTGDILWAKSLGTGYSEYAEKIETTSDGRLMLFAYQNTDPNFSIPVISKFEMDGTMLWTKKLDIQASNGTMSDENFGTQNHTDFTIVYEKYGSNQIEVTRLDLDGNIIWSKAISAVSIYKSVSMKNLSNGSTAVCYSHSHLSNTYGVESVTVLDAAGNEVWTKALQHLDASGCQIGINEIENNEIIIHLKPNLASAINGTLIYKYDLTGNLLSQQFFNNVNNNQFKILPESSGDLYIYGTTVDHGPGAGWGNGFILKTDSNLNPIWYRIYGGLLEDEGNDMLITNDNQLALLGSTESFGISNFDGFLITADTAGNGNCIFMPGIFPQPTTVSFPDSSYVAGQSAGGITLSTFTWTVSAVTPMTVYGCTLALDEQQSAEEIKMYPNPMQEAVTISFGSLNLYDAHLQITDLFGKEVFQSSIDSNEILVARNDLPSGMYLVNVQLQDGTQVQQKLIMD